jgi:GNAT superfamily N-acetyltransferase
MLSFRPGHLADAAAIAALIQQLAPAFLSTPDGDGAEPFWASVSAQAEAGYLASARYCYLTAWQAEQLVGLISLRDCSHLAHLFVAPALQRQGLATQLWQLALTHAAERGHHGPFTVNSSLSAVPVYRRFGFVETGAIQQQHGVTFQPMLRAAQSAC